MQIECKTRNEEEKKAYLDGAEEGINWALAFLRSKGHEDAFREGVKEFPNFSFGCRRHIKISQYNLE